MVLRLFLRSPFIVIGAFIMAFTISPKVTIIFMIAIPILAFIIYGVIAITIPIYKKVQRQLDVVSKKTRENLVGVRVIRAFRRQESEKQAFLETSDRLYDKQVVAGKISALLNPLTYVVVNLAIVAIIWNGGKQVERGIITQGDVIALVNYMTQILLALVALSNLIISFTKATASAGRINEVFELTSTLIDDNNTERPIQETEYRIEFNDVDFAYEGSKETAISKLNLKVKAGESVGIIGGTGSGKSTLVHLIPRFYDVTKGEVLVDGENVKEYPFSQLRSKIGMVPQRAVLFKGTIRQNMQWGKDNATDEEIWKALEIAQAKEFVEQKSDGLDTMVSQGGTNLSGGQRQRLTIARALVGNPEILILDDSASALDFATDAKLRKAIAHDINECTVFIVSQRASSIRHCDQIVVLDDGNVVGIGTHEQLLETCEVYQEICNSQV